MNSILLALGIGVLGGCGATARFWLHSLVVRADPLDFPLGTFLVNVIGSFLLGVLVGAGAGHDLQLLLAVGLLGAFTTFSTWMFETERLVADGFARGAAVNVLISVVIGFAAVAAGVVLGGAL